MNNVNGGARNDSAESIIRKHLPAAFAGKAWDALIAALAVGDQLNWDNAVLAFDQLYKSTASGLYLDRLAGDDGLARPPDIGMPDDLFRKLAIKTSASKLTPEIILEIMEVFYGPDALRASASTDLAEPFRLADGDDLNLLMDERDPVNIIFQASWFNNITAVRAEELAVAITRGLRLSRCQGFAVAYPDPVTNLQKVRIYSGALGLGSSVRITGGRAQLGLHLPTLLTTYSASVAAGDNYNWAVSSPQAGTNRIQLTSIGGSSKVDLSTVVAGDYVVFQAANSSVPAGVYPVTAVSVSFSGSNLVQYLEISANAGAHSFLQLSNSEMTFFRPTRRTIAQAGSRTVVVAQTVAGQLDVQIPATTQAVGRTARTASYLHDSPALGISSLQRLAGVTKVITAAPHGLIAGKQVLVEDVFAGASAPALTLGDPGTGAVEVDGSGLPGGFPMVLGGGGITPGTVGTSDASLASIWTRIRTVDGEGALHHSVTTLANGDVLVAGGYYLSAAVQVWTSGAEIFTITGTATLPSGAKQYSYNWVDTAVMPAVRADHQAALLLNGKALVTGGFDGVSYLNTTALYSAGAWVAGPVMTTQRQAHSQTTLANGLTLIAGGLTDAVTVTALTELYDQAANTLAAGPTMIHNRANHAAVLLADGRVLVAGGRPNTTGSVHSSCELYTPGGGWARTGSMAWARYGHALTLLPDGRVLATGGMGNISGEASVVIDRAEIWDPSIGSWAPAGKMNHPRFGHGATCLAGRNKVLVAGGSAGTITGAEYFDIATLTWRAVPTGPTVLSGEEKLAKISDNLVLLVGGENLDETAIRGWLYQGAEDVYGQGGLNGVFAVAAAPTATEFWYSTPDYLGLTTNQNPSLAVKSMAGQPAGLIPGPFLFDPLGGDAVTAVATVATMSLSANGQYASLDVTDATSFPDGPGWLAIGFGTDTEVAPVRYLGRLSSTALILDYSLKFPVSNLVLGFSASSAVRAGGSTTLTLNLAAGASHGIIVGQSIYFKSTDTGFSSGYKTVSSVTTTTIVFADPGSNTSVANPGSAIVRGPTVTLLKQKGLFMPARPEQVGAAYITASSAGRTAALKALNDSIASGIGSNVTIVYPGDVGLGGAGLGTTGQALSDKVAVFAGDDIDTELAEAKGEG